MASIALPPIQMNGSDLQFGNVTVPLKTASSFWVINKKTHEICVYCHNGDYQTTFRLYLEKSENMHECIRAFMEQTDMKPSLFWIRSVKPIVEDTDEKGADVSDALSNATVEFTFMDPEELDYFQTHAMPLLEGFTIKTRVEGDNAHVATLSYNEPETTQHQVRRINDVFQRIIGQFGSSALNECLVELRDKRFPGEPRQMGGQACEEAWSREHLRDFDVTMQKMSERISMGYNTHVLAPVDEGNLQEWLATPEAQQGQQTKRYESYVLDLLSAALLEQPVDNTKVQPLMNLALAIPGFNVVAFMEKVGEMRKKLEP